MKKTATKQTYFNQDYIDLLLIMTGNEIKARYKGTVAGFFWMIINPLLQMLIIGFVFSFFIKVPNYFLFLFVGLLPWQFFSTSLSKATKSFVSARFLLQKTKFAKEIIPLSIVLSDFTNLLISITLLSLLLIITKNLTLASIFLISISLIWLLILTSSISLLTASLNVRYRDVSFLVDSFLKLLFYATPILYNLTQVPQKIQRLLSFNPLVSIFELFHKSMLNSGSISKEILFQNIFITLLIILVSIINYKKTHSSFVDWL